MLIINKDTTDLDYQIITQIEKVKQQQEVKIRAFNHDIQTACYLAEMIKHRLKGLYQINNVQSEGNDVFIDIYLSLTVPNQNHYGFQAPLEEREVEEFSEQQVKDFQEKKIVPHTEVSIKEEEQSQTNSQGSIQEVRISMQQNFRQILYVCLDKFIFQQQPVRSLKIVAAGKAIPKCCYIAEMLKRRVKGLSQVNNLTQTENMKVSTNNKGVPEQKMVSFPRMEILLSKDEVDTTHYGYQPPIDQELVQEPTKEQRQQQKTHYQQNQNQNQNYNNPNRNTQRTGGMGWRRRGGRRQVTHISKRYGNRGDNSQDQYSNNNNNNSSSNNNNNISYSKSYGNRSQNDNQNQNQSYNQKPQIQYQKRPQQHQLHKQYGNREQPQQQQQYKQVGNRNTHNNNQSDSGSVSRQSSNRKYDNNNRNYYQNYNNNNRNERGWQNRNLNRVYKGNRNDEKRRDTKQQVQYHARPRYNNDQQGQGNRRYRQIQDNNQQDNYKNQNYQGEYNQNRQQYQVQGNREQRDREYDNNRRRNQDGNNGDYGSRRSKQYGNRGGDNDQSQNIQQSIKEQFQQQ